MLAALGGLLSGDYGGGNINAGVDAQMRAGRDAQRQLKETWNEQKNFAMPWLTQGQGALSSLAAGNFMDKWQQDPGYQFRLQQGQQAIQGSQAARGLNNSGATLKALAQFGQNLGSQEYQNVYNRESNRLNTVAGFGANALGGLMGGAQNYGNNMANVTTGMGNAQAAGSMAHAQGRQNQQAGLMNLVGAGLGAAAMFSDKRVKKDIKPLSEKDIEEFKASIKPYSFKYKDEKYGKGDWSGVLAQDLEKSKLGKQIVEEVDGVKQINLSKLASLSLALMAETEDENEEMDEE